MVAMSSSPNHRGAVVAAWPWLVMIAVLESVIAVAALLSSQVGIDFGTWNLALLTLPILVVAAYRRRTWLPVGLVAGAPHVVAGAIAWGRVEVSSANRPAPLGGLGVLWALLMTVGFLVACRLATAASDRRA